MEYTHIAKLAEQNDQQLRLMRRQLMWTRIFALCCVALVAVFIIFILPLVHQTKNVLTSIESYTEIVDEVTDELADITETLGVVSEELKSVDYETVIGNLTTTSDALASIDWSTIASDLTEISSQLSEIDWQKLADDIDETALTAQESLTAINELDLEALNDAIIDLQTVVEPLADIVDKLN